jgi:hypothetical protein
MSMWSITCCLSKAILCCCAKASTTQSAAGVHVLAANAIACIKQLHPLPLACPYLSNVWPRSSPAAPPVVSEPANNDTLMEGGNAVQQSIATHEAMDDNPELMNTSSVAAVQQQPWYGLCARAMGTPPLVLLRLPWHVNAFLEQKTGKCTSEWGPGAYTRVPKVLYTRNWKSSFRILPVYGQGWIQRCINPNPFRSPKDTHLEAKMAERS